MANSYDGEQAAKVFISDNSGDTWAEETTGDVSTSQWVDAAMSDDGTVVSVLNQDEVRISTDSGATWHAEDPGQTYEDTNTWQSIDFNSDGTDAIVAGLENAYITTGASPDPSTPSVNLVNPENSKAIQITTPDGTTITCHSAVKESGLAAQDAGYTYPLGLVDFCFDTNEESNTVTLTFVTDLTPAQAVIRKYNPTTNVYSSITGAGVTETTYEGQHALQVTYTIVDNGPLDLDPDEGEIADPVGIGVTEQAELSNTGQSSVIYLSAATLLTLVSIALIRLRKQVSTRA